MQNPLPLAEKTSSDRLKTLASQNFSQYSLEMRAVRSRSMIAAANAVEPSKVNRDLTKCASDNVEARRLAEQYAVYKLDALERIAHRETDLALTARLAIRQNHLA
jgi:hypothetical protein